MSETNQEVVTIPDAAQDVTLLRLITEGKNPRGIPSAKFIVSD
jgi:hypothetical protein